MRVLVTGGTGFVGRHLVQLLARHRHTVFATYLTAPADALPSAELLGCDMRNPDQVLRTVRLAQPQQVYHLAGLSSVTKSFAEARQVWEANVFAAMNLLDALRETAPKARILLVGSGQCYGRVARDRLPITEDEPAAPENPYAASKAAADLLGLQFFHSCELNVVRARPFNHTGPGQSPDFVCSNLARQVAEISAGLRPPKLCLGNLRVERDFSDVRDVVRAYELLLRHGQAGQAYNVASGRGVAISAVVRILQSFCPVRFKVEVERSRVRAGEVDRLFGSNRKLRRTTGWKPEYPLSRTLRDLYSHWYRQLVPQSSQS